MVRMSKEGSTIPITKGDRRNTWFAIKLCREARAIYTKIFTMVNWSMHATIKVCRVIGAMHIVATRLEHTSEIMWLSGMQGGT